MLSLAFIHMKLRSIRCISLMALLGVVLSVGCGRGERPESVEQQSQESPATSTSSVPGQPLATTAQQLVTRAAGEAEALIDQTRAFLKEQNYAGAAEGLEKLAGMSLTPEQEQLVQELRVEVAKVSDVAGERLGEVKALVDAKQYEAASVKLAELANVELTPEQKQLVEKLKAEIQKGLSGQAVESGKKALDGLLKGN